MQDYKYIMHSIKPNYCCILTKDLDDNFGPMIELTLNDDLTWNLKSSSKYISAIVVLNIIKFIFDRKEPNITSIRINISSMKLDINSDSIKFELNKSFEFRKSKDNKVEDYYEVLLDSLMFSCRYLGTK